MRGASLAPIRGVEARRRLASRLVHGQRCQLVLPGAFGTGTAVVTGEEKQGLGGHADGQHGTG
jgi:hypothetical protein